MTLKLFSNKLRCLCRTLIQASSKEKCEKNGLAAAMLLKLFETSNLQQFV